MQSTVAGARQTVHRPQRTCAVCRRKEPNDRLLRFVLAADADALKLVLDAEKRLPGRGAWCHPSPGCLAHKAFFEKVTGPLRRGALGSRGLQIASANAVGLIEAALASLNSAGGGGDAVSRTVRRRGELEALLRSLKGQSPERSARAVKKPRLRL